jgi:CheY-like chemotaxis protein
MQMPNMDGLELATRIRRHLRLAGKPLILLTSLGRHEDTQKSVEFAAQLTKPVRASQLYEVLVSVIARQPVVIREAKVPVSKLSRDVAERNPLRILLAEDNAVNQKVALRILDRLGYRADVVGNGLEVLDSLHRQKYDVILMDISMPEMDGIEATRRIRSEFSYEDQPFIAAMTAHALEGDRERFMMLGMDGYISKPIEITIL